MMKNNKMKKMISMMVAVLLVCSVLTVHASAAGFYEFSGNKTTADFKSAFNGSDAEVSLDSDDVYTCTTYTIEDDAIVVLVSASFTYNVDGGTSETYTDEKEINDLFNPSHEETARVDSSEIASDYTIYDFSGYHYVASALDSDYVYIGTSSR